MGGRPNPVSGQSGYGVNDSKHDKFGKEVKSDVFVPTDGRPEEYENAQKSSCLGRLWTTINSSTTNKCLCALYVIALIAMVILLVKTPTTTLSDTAKVVTGISVALAPFVLYILHREYGEFLTCCKRNPGASRP